MDRTKKMIETKVSRRDVLRVGAMGAGLLALGPLGRYLPAARGAPANLTRMVVLNLSGGNDSTNMVIPTTLTPYQERRESLAIPAGSRLSLDSGPNPTTSYALHPALASIAGMWADDDVAVVNKVGYPNANLSHFKSQDIMSLGVRGSFAGLGVQESGWVARFADHHAPTALGAVSVGVGRPLDFVGGTSNPLLVKSLSSFKLNYRGSQNAHFHRLDTAKSMLDRFTGGGDAAQTKAALGQAHDLTDQIQAAVTGYQGTVEYTNDRPSRYLKDIAILIEGGFETRVFYTGYGGFDTHSGQGTVDGNHATLLGRLDDGIASFAADLKRLGVWDQTVICVITEFGRRNFENGSAGTDHGHGFAEILIGGAVNGGMYGPDLTEDDLNEKYLAYDVDFRSIYKEVMSQHLGADPSLVFPEALEKEAVLGVV